MNFINSLTKMVQSKAIMLKKYLASIVGALLLLVAGVQNQTVAESPVLDAFNIVGAPTISTLLAVEHRFAGSTRIIYNCQTAERYHFADGVTVKLSAKHDGLPPGGCYCYPLWIPKSIEMDNKSILNDLDKTVLTGMKLGVFDDFVGQQLLKCHHYGILDSFIVGTIEKRVKRELRRMAFSGTPFLPPKLHNGDFIFGYDQRKNKIMIFRQYFNAGTLMVAGTGAGKTNLSKYHSIQIAPCVRGMWLIDIRKKEFRSLRPIFARMGIDLKIIRGRKFRFNPLQVPYGVEPIEYAAVAADFLVRVFNLPPRSSTLLRSMIIKLYMAYGVLDGGQKYPTLFHLFEAIRANRDANPQARQATLDNLEAILLAMGPEMLAYHRGWSVDELTKQHLVMELAGLPEAGKDLILNYLITAEFISRIARGISNPEMDLWISFDEGQRLFSQRKESATYGGNALIDLTGLVRGTGIGLEISVLTTNDLSTNIPNLTSTKIIGRCGSMAEYTTAGHFMGLSSEQIIWCAHHMVPGLFAGQVGEGSWRYPFLFSVPLVSQIKAKHVSDQEADSSIHKVVNTKLLPSKELF